MLEVDKPKPADLDDLLRVYNDAVAAPQGVTCVVGAETKTRFQMAELTLEQEFLVHRDQAGQVDGFVCWTELGMPEEEAVAQLLMAHPDHPKATYIMALLAQKMLEAVAAKGYYGVSGDAIDNVPTMEFRFTIGGIVQPKPWRGEPPREVRIRWEAATSIPLLQKVIDANR